MSALRVDVHHRGATKFTNLSSSPSLTRFRPRKSAARIRGAMKPRAESTDPRSAVKITSTRRARIIFGGGGEGGREQKHSTKCLAGYFRFSFSGRLGPAVHADKRGRAGSTPPFMSAHTRPTYSHVKSKREGEGRGEREREREGGREGEREKETRVSADGCAALGEEHTRSLARTVQSHP